MRVNREVFAFVALLLVIRTNGIRVIEDVVESTTKAEKFVAVKTSSESMIEVKSTASLIDVESRSIENDYHVTSSSSTTEKTYTISPTLINVKLEEKDHATMTPVKVAKDIG